MTELAPKIANQQETPPQHYYHDATWRLRAEVPWAAFTLILAVILSSTTLFSQGQFAPDTLPHIVTLGFIVIPTAILIASGDADLSSGMLAGLVCQIVDSLRWRIGLGPAIFISLLAALGVGSINGLLVGPGRLKGIFVTFGMRYVLNGIILVLHTLMMPVLPLSLMAFSRSSIILVLWILLVLACAVIMIFTRLGRRHWAGEPEPLGRTRLLSKGLPFVFSSLMAWISGVLLLGWAGYASIGSGLYFAEIALCATFLGGTAYSAGTGFVLSGAIALIDIVLFQQLLGLSTAKLGIILGALTIIMLPIVCAYHTRIERLYQQQREKTKEASGEEAPQPR